MVTQFPELTAYKMLVGYVALMMASLVFLVASVSLCETMRSRAKGWLAVCLYESILVALSVGFLTGSPSEPMDTVVSRLCWSGLFSSFPLAALPVLWRLERRGLFGERPTRERSWGRIALIIGIQLLLMNLILEAYFVGLEGIETMFN